MIYPNDNNLDFYAVYHEDAFDFDRCAQWLSIQTNSLRERAS